MRLHGRGRGRVSARICSQLWRRGGPRGSCTPVCACGGDPYAANASSVDSVEVASRLDAPGAQAGEGDAGTPDGSEGGGGGRPRRQPETPPARAVRPPFFNSLLETEVREVPWRAPAPLSPLGLYAAVHVLKPGPLLFLCGWRLYCR